VDFGLVPPCLISNTNKRNRSMNDLASSRLTRESAWRRIWRFLRALDEGLRIDEISLLARVTRIERELAKLKER
jgi:hypothetical protein